MEGIRAYKRGNSNRVVLGHKGERKGSEKNCTSNSPSISSLENSMGSSPHASRLLSISIIHPLDRSLS